MIAVVLAGIWALAAAGVPPSLPPSPAVRLAPVRCVDLPDATVRAPLRVEIGRRLLDDGAADGPEVLLVSIACNGSDATVLAVRQNQGGEAVRRLVPLGEVAPEARSRELALAAAELIHVADVRDNTPPPAIVRATAQVPPPPQPTWTLTFNASALYWGGYLSNDFFAMDGAALNIGVEHGPLRPTSPSWQWALATELTAFGGPYRSAFMAGLSGMLQRRGTLFVPELGLGGRAGVVNDFPTETMTTTRTAGGPVASIGVSTRFLPGLSSDFVIESGYDFGGPGAWILPRLGFTVRFW